MKPDWDIESAIATYNVDGWGSGYFTVNSDGNVVVAPLQLTAHAEPEIAPYVGWDGRQFLVALASAGSLRGSRVAAGCPFGDRRAKCRRTLPVPRR